MEDFVFMYFYFLGILVPTFQKLNALYLEELFVLREAPSKDFRCSTGILP